MKYEDDYRAVAEEIAAVDTILIITGAGLSVDSGLPAYRGIGGLYEGKNTEDGMPIELALSGTMLRNQPEVTWKYLWEIAEVCRGAKPNRGHEIIAEIGRLKPNTWVLTQNVDGLHAAAGSKNLIEIHGRASNLLCSVCNRKFDGEKLLFESGLQCPKPPECLSCGHVLRPDVVLFEEQLPAKAVSDLEALVYADVGMVISAGTSSLFPYISGPVELASAAGIPCVEINQLKTGISNLATYRFEMSCTEALEEIFKRIGH